MANLPSLDTKIPTNMAAAVEDALDGLVAKYGDLVPWMEKELGYKPGELGNYLAAEQVDAAALALDNVKKGAAFIIGDQTGIGKGRVVASMLRYAIRKGMTPIFVTEKPNLYGDIMRDLNDIGIAQMLGRDVRPFLTNAGVSVPLDDEAVTWFDDAETAKAEGKKPPEKRGKFLRASTGDAHKKQMAALQQGGKDFDIIFSTYDQMNTVKGQSTDRRRLVSALAPNAFIVLDESHNAGGTEAGGTEAGGWEKEGAELNRSDYLKEVTGRAKAVMFSSATYAKRPQSMALYARTDMGKAVEHPEMLGALITAGGVPMQQVVASMLSKAGQYIRRERSFDGVSYDVEPVPVDREAYRTVSRSLARIAKFDKELKGSDVWDEIIQGLKESGEAAAFDSATGGTSVTSTNFTSLMHNIVGQMLLAIKVDAVADRAIASLKAGEKPVITVSSTMGTFLKTYAEENSVSKGDDVSLSFRDVLRRYLERTMRLTIKEPDGEKRHFQIPLSMLPSDLRALYDEARDTIASLPTENMPISPIDWLHYRLKKAGYRVAEITGRKETLDYGGPNKASFSERPDSDISPAGRTIAVKKFNAGDIDAMILNRAGSTGLSLHAKKGFKDVRRRRMIIAQPEANIDVHMQMLGRVHRTGQVIAPAFSQAYAEVPAEARPAAVLAKKMASLNANTTAARKSAFSADDSVDFLNKYGDEVAREFLRENPQIASDLDYKVTGSTDQEVARDLTGKMALLEIEDQQKVIDEITARYKVLMDNLNALGENALEAKTVDLKAKMLSRTELKAGEGESPFTQAVQLEEIETRTTGKALPIAEIIQRASKAQTGAEMQLGKPATDIAQLNQNVGIRGRNGQSLFFQKWLQDFGEWSAEVLAATKTAETKQKRREEMFALRDRFVALTELATPGKTVTVSLGDNDALPGIVMDVKRREAGTNPLALGSWSAEIAIPDNAQRIIVPFSSIALDGDAVADNAKKVFLRAPDWALTPEHIVEVFENARKEGKETRFMVTGNILAGFDQTKGRGQIINYTDDAGNVKPGILMNRQFNTQQFMNERAVRFKTGAQVVEFIGKVADAEISSSDKLITVRADGPKFEIELPAGRGTGGQYFLNPKVRAAAGDRFAKVGSKMRHTAPNAAAAVRVLDAMIEAGALFQTTSQQDEAEAIIKASEPPKEAPLSSRSRLSAAKTPGFYSGLLRAVENLKQEKAPAAQWLGTIRNQPGVKPEEIAWLGLDDWLSQQTGNRFRFILNQKQAAQIVYEIGNAAERILGHHLVKVVIVTNQEAWNGVFAEHEVAFFDPNTSIIYVALHGTQDPRLTVRHEAIHVLRHAGVFTAKEWAVLTRVAQSHWMHEFNIRERYESLYRQRFDLKPDQIEQLLIEEAIAEAFADHLSTRPQDEALITRIFNRVMRFIEAVRNLLAGHGYTTAEQVLQEVETGAMGRRRAGEGQARQFPLSARQDSLPQAPLSSRARLRPPRNPAAGSFDAPHDERVMRALNDTTDTLLGRLKRAGKAFAIEGVRKLQDREVDLLRTQNAITKASGPIAESKDAYLAASLYPGRVAQKDKDLLNDVIKPLVKDIAARGLSLREVDDFVRARHGIERNLVVGQLYKPGEQFHDAMSNPALKGASGLSEDEITQILDGFQNSGKLADLEAVGDKIVALNARSLRAELAEGLIDQDLYDQLTTQYRYYVPLRGWDEATSDAFPDAPRTGSRFDIRGKEHQQAFGRTTLSDSPLAFSILQARQAIIRIENNRVAKRFLRLAQANPNEAFWQVERRDLKKVIDKGTGLVRRVYDRGSTQAENVFAAKVGGQTFHVTLHQDGLLRAMKGIGTANMHSAVVFFHKINRYLAAIKTSLDPEFIFRNFLRDLQHAGIVLQEEKQKGLVADVLKSIPQATAGMNRMLNGDLSTHWARVAREFADAGGKVGFMDRGDIDAEKRNLNRLMKSATGGAGRKTAEFLFEATFGRIERYNDDIENTLRLATYAGLRNRGVSKDKAAFVARELTVNFNRKGEWGPFINAFYLFFNASMQGGAQLAVRLKRSKRLRYVAAGIVGAALVQDIINRMIAGDDDDDKNRYDKIPDDIKARFAIIMMPKWIEEKYGIPYFKWPLPLGWNMFHVIGTQAGHVLMGARTPLEGASNMVGAIGDAFNPLGSGGFVNWLAPTLMDPAIDLYANTDFWGDDIVPKTYDDTKPLAERYNQNVTPGAKMLTDTLSKATGGSPERPGSIDVSPEQVEYLWDFATGGVGRLLSRAWSTGDAIAGGDAWDAMKTPFVRVFVGQDSKYIDRDEYYQIKNAVEITQKELKGRTEDGDAAAVERVRRDHAPEVQMIKFVDKIEKRLAKLRKDARNITANDAMPDDAKKTALDGINAERDRLQQIVRKRWNQIQKTTNLEDAR